MRNFILNATADSNANVDRGINADRRTVVADALMAGGAGEVRQETRQSPRAQASTSHYRHAPQDFTSKRVAPAKRTPGLGRLYLPAAPLATTPSCRWRLGSEGASLAARTRG